MELWVRSQDKDSLIKVEKIELIYDYLCCDDIQLIHIETDKGRIGSYATKERALEVLDEIQKLLKPTFNIYEPKEYDKPRVCTDLTPSIKVYEMPEE